VNVPTETLLELDPGFQAVKQMVMEALLKYISENVRTKKVPEREEQKLTPEDESHLTSQGQ
jgi:hypothetical protein